MNAPSSIDPAAVLHEHLAQASPDQVRQLLSRAIDALLSADADAVCGAGWGQVSSERVNRRNGYRHRDLDTRVGTIDGAVPNLRTGSYSPEWLQIRRRADQALTSVVGTCYPLGMSIWRMDMLVQSLRDHVAVPLTGVGDGQGPRRPGRGLPHPAAGRRPVHVRGRGRVDDEAPRERPGGQRGRAGRHR